MHVVVYFAIHKHMYISMYVKMLCEIVCLSIFICFIYNYVTISKEHVLYHVQRQRKQYVKMKINIYTCIYYLMY